MVSYCCVKDCRNNSGEKWKGSNGIITFHVFPTKPEARDRWLKAIGRPGWDPPSHARICSAHFSDHQINREHQRTRLKEDACPVQCLPVNSHFEASQMEVCRICLVMDVKMYSLQDELLKISLKSIVGLNKDIEGLPQYVCYECASLLLKSHNLIEKSLIAKATLMNIFSENGEVTKSLIKTINRTKLNLKSSLTYNTVIPKTIIDLHYDNDLEKYVYTSKLEENICTKELNNITDIDIPKKTKSKFNTPKKKQDKCNKIPDFKIQVNDDLNNALDEYKLDESYLENNIVSDNFVNVNEDVKEDASDSDPDHTIDNIEQYDSKNVESFESFEEVPIKEKKLSRKKVKNPDGLTPDEIEMQKHFEIVILSLEEQIEDREKMKTSDAYRDALYKCDICYKTYLHPNAHKMHMENHDPSRGKAECPVCRLRYKNDVLARSHANRTHGKKFYCKACPKFFYNIRIAKKHQKRHEGYLYKCDICEFSSVHESAYSSHVRWHQRKLETEDVKLDDSLYSCKECDVRFTSESAWRIHILTSKQHKEQCNISTTSVEAQWCRECGVQFPTAALLRQHAATHRAAPKANVKQDSYPEPCAYCGETMNNRKEHYFHIRKMHPKERASYQPVITAVCDTCGKGFQNSTKLHLHELRHGGPGTVRCPHCPRLFYDKYQLSRHVGVHSDARPHACRLCDKAFKLRSNLDRHAKVHSGATPYECTMCGKRFRYSSSRNLHVRSVHYKLPPPPRRKRLTKRVQTIEHCPQSNIT